MKVKGQAVFPLTMTVISFLVFILIYLYVTVFSIEKYYLQGLIFLIPSLCFGAITILAFQKKLSVKASSIMTGILIPVFAIVMFFVFVVLSLDAATTTTTDISSYKSVLTATGYPDNVLTKSFPSQIPDDASNVRLRYNPAFLQGGENFVLQFETKSESIATYQDMFCKEANEFKLSKATLLDYDYEQECFSLLGYNEIPSGYTCYLLYSTPYHSNNWNHGAYSFVAINTDLNTIIFAESDW